MKKCWLAVDIGASSGRHILGRLEDGRIVLEEIYRFPNGMQKKDGHLVWDTDALRREVFAGIKAAKPFAPASVGIDTWAVDYVLLDGAGARIGDAYGYRDGRTGGMDSEVYKLIGEGELYARTGIQKQPFNTIYQLMAEKTLEPERLKRAERMLMIPDYLGWLLTGRAVCEYTNASTTQLTDPHTRDWDWELIDRLGYPRRIFQPVAQPGSVLGELSRDARREIGFDCRVALPATHDTGSAVLAARGDGVYISSGTWSLMGVERREADCSARSGALNFTNEGGYGGTIRYLKNIMGLWMIQSLRRELGGGMSFDELCALAEASGMESEVDCNDPRFLAPESMTQAIKDACRESGQCVPESAGELARVVYRSLAKCYAQTADSLEKLCGRRFEAINIVGGGSGDDYLNRLTAERSGRRVAAGPKEATAIGNLMAQMLADGTFGSAAEARECVRRSFEIKEYEGRQ